MHFPIRRESQQLEPRSLRDADNRITWTSRAMTDTTWREQGVQAEHCVFLTLRLPSIQAHRTHVADTWSRLSGILWKSGHRISDRKNATGVHSHLVVHR